jgi:hypothetical protein
MKQSKPPEKLRARVIHEAQSSLSLSLYFIDFKEGARIQESTNALQFYSEDACLSSS